MLFKTKFVCLTHFDVRTFNMCLFGCVFMFTKLNMSLWDNRDKLRVTA